MNKQNNTKPKNPNPNQSKALQPKNPRPVSAANNPVRNARVSDGFQHERTAVFDKIEGKKNTKTGVVKAAPKPEGTYNYTGRDIKSSRQKFADPIENTEGISVKKSREKTKEEHIEPRGGGFISGIFKAVLYIIGVVAVSVILAYNIIMITNEVFAFVKTPSAAEITLPQTADIDSISRILSENKLIKYPSIFRLYANLRSRNKNWEFRGGETFVVSADMGYDDFIAEFRVRAAARQEIRLAFPEGFTIDQIIDRLVENGVGERSNYEYIINNHQFEEYDFLKPLYASERDKDITYILEGYLFPDTYDFFTNENEFNVIRKFLNNFDVKFDVRSYERLKILDMSLDELIILASMIQREARDKEDFSKVSAVFHNRLLNSADFPYLESDATILYEFDEHKIVTPEDLELDLPYNTYLRPGLPPSAISNPGSDAIHAALEPHEEYVGYYYFVAQRNGINLYSQTYAGHQANIAAAWGD